MFNIRAFTVRLTQATALTGAFAVEEPKSLDTSGVLIKSFNGKPHTSLPHFASFCGSR
jgi:hypothetical protein